MVTSGFMEEVARVTLGGDFLQTTPRNPSKPSLGLSSPSPPRLGHRLLAPSHPSMGRWGGAAPLWSHLPGGSPSFASHANTVGMS